MICVRTYQDALAAQRAAEWLRSHGVNAQVVGHHVHALAPNLPLRFASIQLVVRTREDAALAAAALSEMDANPPRLEEGWEDAHALPDLSRLDPGAVPITCPACAGPLPIDAHAARCPSCAAPVDIVARIVETHGPEALTHCYELDDPDPDGPRGPLPVSIPRRCPSCHERLDSPARRGRCPRCGELYDADDHRSRRPTQ